MSKFLSMFHIYHNPRCRISHAVLAELLKISPEAEIIEYSKNIPSVADLKKLLSKLNLKPSEIIRRNEKIFKERFRGKNFTEDEWIKIMREYPILIERPIVVKNNKAVICRPSEKFHESFV